MVMAPCSASITHTRWFNAWENSDGDEDAGASTCHTGENGALPLHYNWQGADVNEAWP